MKHTLLFTCLLFLTGMTIHANKSAFPILDPVATMTGNTTICPNNVAVITVSGTANSVAGIRNLTTHQLITISLLATGTATFTTPGLTQTTTYSLESITELATGNTTTITGVTVTINVVPNGCTTVFTDGSTGVNTIPICSAGECRTLTATPTPIASTTSYDVSSIPYCPQAAFYDPSYNQVSQAEDDIWSAPISLPFSFSFFNQNYTTCQIGSNGLISFNAQAFPGFCDWQLHSLNSPNPSFTHLNAILAAFQDTDIRTAGGQAPPEASVNWTMTGTYPCRKLIVNFYHLGQYQCNQSVGLQTTQIVLYELSNIIEVYVQSRTRCTTWENGEGVIGIINANGILGYVPPGRNTNSGWIANNEAWRFTPNGPNVSVIVQWLENGNVIANGTTVTVCPAVTTSYVAQASYVIGGTPFTVNGPQNTIVVASDETQSPNDLSVCYEPTGSYVVDLTSNNAAILNGANPANYEIYYFTSLSDAELLLNPIADPASFAFTQNQILYAAVTNFDYSCVYIKPFELIILDVVGAPTGLSPQTLNPGQTLGNIAVTGQNVQWYDAPTGGNLLPTDTVVQNNITYYASQTVNSCESRSTQSSRLAILVQLALGVIEFDNNAFNIYPNPTTNVLTLTSNLLNVKLDVFNTLSQKIAGRLLENGANVIDLSNLSSGVYLFQLSLDGKTKTYKIVKN